MELISLCCVLIVVSEHYLDKIYTGELLETWGKIVIVLNLNNHDRSDVMTDYFDIGHYVSIRIGKWNKPFITK